MIGKSFSHYEVQEKIGEGGMGEVYRAQDSKLRRAVAIKVLPSHLLNDEERLARFEREAQVLASLNHPNIAAIFGVETSDEHRCLVMELVEGDDLAARLAQGPFPPGEVRKIGLQIAQALEAAHESGVIHRDLKPANVKLRPDGLVKVLDFGLAKAVEGDPAGGSSPVLSNSPTLTGMMTGANVILGTAAYMSPEQARGQTVDKRADIWAFGCVLFELLTGKLAYSGDTISDTLASVLKSEPDWDALPANTPPYLRRLIERCLEKDPAVRLRDIGEARIALETGDDAWAPAPVETATARGGIPAWVAAALAVLVVAAGVSAWTLKPEPRAERIHGVILPPAQSDLILGSGGHMALSPDGSRLAFAALDSTNISSIWVRNLSDADSHRLSGTEGAINPFWSPDGTQLGFFANGKLRRMTVAGGAPLSLCDAPNGRGGTWAPDGTITFAPSFDSGLWSVSADGGEAREILPLAEGSATHRWPQRIEGGILFLAGGGSAQRGIHFLPDDGPTRHLVEAQGQARYRDGRLYYTVDGALFARAFDPSTAEFRGDPRTVATDLYYSVGFGRSVFDVGAGHRVVYVTATQSRAERQVARYARDGSLLESIDLGSGIFDIALSPDGRFLAYSKDDDDEDGFDIWSMDLERRVQTRLTFSELADDPVWSPDGRSIAYADSGHIRVMSVAGTVEHRTITRTETDDCTHDWSPDGRYIVWSRNANELQIWIHDLEDGSERALLTGQQYTQARFSPDGRWLAYLSRESGDPELYIQDFPAMQQRWQVSARGGMFPMWARSGREIVYLSGEGQFVSVDVEPSLDGLRIGRENPLFRTRLSLDRSIQSCLHPDGESIWQVGAREGQTVEGSRRTPIQFVLNWDTD